MAPSSPPIKLLLLLLLLRWLRLLSGSTNTLQPGDVITANSTLTASNGAFILGFFYPTATSRCYLGIWRSGSLPTTAIWVANRESPVPHSSAVFRLSAASTLEVSDSATNVTHWSTSHTTTLRPFSGNTSAVLLESGNLIIYNAGRVLWQSFEHATDTVVPGTFIWANYRIHKAATAVSWRTPDDPALGDFSLSLDPEVRMQGIVLRRGRRWWRSNVWKGVSYSDLTLNSSVQPYLSYTITSEWLNFTFSLSSQATMAVRLEHNGTANIRIWSGRAWQKIYSWTDGVCSMYATCGTFAYCAKELPRCRCLEGFSPASREGPAGGCVRRDELGCGGEDRFVKYEDMKVPDFNIYMSEIRNESACRDACAGNCSCVAYAYADMWTGAGSGAVQARCLVWVGDLVDIVFNNDGNGEDLYVKVRNAGGGKKKAKKIVIVVVPIACCGLILLLASTYLVWKRKKDRGEIKNNKIQVGANNGDTSLYSSVEDYNIISGCQDLPLLDYHIVVSATDNFSDLNKIGQGGFGNVYKGKLEGGQEVAIKKLNKESCQGLAEFVNEVVLIAKLQHRNLVKLLNCCVHRDERLLIYEYMPNRSLELFLFDSENHMTIDWTKRFNIIKGIARGLSYLHEESRLKVIHRDLKASNILLDGDMNAKISDFGMARIFEGNQNEANTRRIVGTYGYISPEYAMEGIFSAKSDVYSFGVLLLEIISGRRNNNNNIPRGFPSLLSYAWEVWSGENQMEIVAPTIRDSCSIDEVIRCTHIGLLCVQDDLKKRPTMSSVVFLLENEAEIRMNPEKPIFTGWTSQGESTNQVRYPEVLSSNHLSVTILEGR